MPTTPPPVELSVTAKRIRELVQISGLTTAEFARRVSISPQTLRGVTSGYQTIRESNLIRIARKTGVSASWLRGETDDRDE